MTDRVVPGSTAADPLWWAWSDSRLLSAADRAVVAGFRLAGRSLDSPVVRRVRALLHRGGRVECPICGSRFRHFAATPTTKNEQCWRCGSHARHRALQLLLERVCPDLLSEGRDVLHFAPEPFVEAWVRPRAGRYVSGDIDPSVGQLRLDLMALELPDESFDLVICSHVLEHVPDDGVALGELRRVLRPHGTLLVMVPIDYELAETDEDLAIADPAERARRFWQEDHMRLYGRDVAERLASGGRFAVETLKPAAELGDAAVARHGLGYRNDLFVCRPSRDLSES